MRSLFLQLATFADGPRRVRRRGPPVVEGKRRMSVDAERSSRYRLMTSPAGRLFQRALLWSLCAAAFLFVFEAPSRLGFHLLGEQYLGFILILVLVSTFIAMPATASAPRDRLPWYDVALMILGAFVGGYLVVFYPSIVTEIGTLSWDKIVASWIALFVVMEAARRLSGWVLLIIAGFFIFYARYSFLFPGMFYADGIAWSRIVVHLYIDPNALLGIPLAIVANIVVAFIFFGQVLFASGGGDFFTDLAKSSLGRFRGGAAKISVLASTLFGSISGSPVANVMVTGYVTIPMMKRTGYRPEVAGAVESVASNGGQLMPPVMGAAVFVMAEFLGWTYAQVALAALIPALLYYVALFVQVDLEAGKQGISRLLAEEIPPIGKVFREGWIFIILMATIIYLMFFLNLNAAKAGFYAAGVAIALSFLKPKSRITPRRLLAVLEATGFAVLEVAVVCAVAGLVIGVLTLTGAAFVFTMMVEQLGANNLPLILVMTAMVALVLGMGMPTTAVYVIVGLTLAPALVKLGVPEIGAHLFVFYYAMLSLITPPICIAAFAAAAIAGSSPMQTGMQCVKLGIMAYLIPFVFVLDPLLLMQGPPLLVLLAFATAVVGTIAIGVSMIGFFRRHIAWHYRALLLIGGIALLLPPGGEIARSWIANAIGAAICLSVLLVETWGARRAQAR